MWPARGTDWKGEAGASGVGRKVAFSGRQVGALECI